MGHSIHSADAFATSFVRGFSFVDDIRNRKRLQEKLDERIKNEEAARAHTRELQDAQEGRRVTAEEDRITDRGTRLNDIQRAREAQALLADINTPSELLQEYADIPAVAQRLFERGEDVQQKGDIENIFNAAQDSRGLNAQAAGPPQVTQQPGDGGLNNQVTGALLPPDEFAGPNQGVPIMDSRDLGELADTDPQKAMQVRDAQKERLGFQSDDDEIVNVGIGGANVFKTKGEIRKKKEAELRGSKRDIVNNYWEAFLDVENTSGDEARNLDPSLQTAKYFEDRSNITGEQKLLDLDKRMRPVIHTTIGVQQEALTAALDPDGEGTARDVANAKRKLSQAYGLANTIGLQYDVLAASGVDDRGFPIGKNTALTDSVMQQTIGGPGLALAPDPATTAVDITRINRGVRGARMNPSLATSLYRQYKNGMLDFTQYKSLYDTGKLPGSQQVFVSHDPKDDLFIETNHPDGSVTRKMVQRARDPAANKNGRNLLSDEGYEMIKSIATAYNTPDDPQRGTNLVLSFLGMIDNNEKRLTERGYVLDNAVDAAGAMRRWLDLYVNRDEMDDEWFGSGQFRPKFVQKFGELTDAFFNPRVDEELTLAQRDSNADFGDAAAPLQNLKPRDPRIYDAIRQQAPEFANASDEVIEQALQEQGR